MKALVYQGKEKVGVEDRPLPVAGAVTAPTAVLREPMRPSANRLISNSSSRVLASTERTKI